jgi:hypothetical protein
MMAQNKAHFRTVDFSELYAGIPSSENIMTETESSYPDHPYHHHSSFVERELYR